MEVLITPWVGRLRVFLAASDVLDQTSAVLGPHARRAQQGLVSELTGDQGCEREVDTLGGELVGRLRPASWDHVLHASRKPPRRKRDGLLF